MADNKDTYTSGAVSDLLGIPPRTARRYLTTGKIPATQNPITGTWKINKQDLIEFMKKYDLDTSKLEDPMKIMVVDDDPAVIKLIVMTLIRSEFRLAVVSTTDGYEALIRLGKEVPDLVVLDIQMPGTDGRQILKVIKESEHTQKVKILVVTGYPDLIDEMKQLGADDGMSKPFKPTELIDKIKKMLPKLEYKKATEQ